MDVLPPDPARRSSLGPWLVILLGAPLLLGIVGLTLYRWRAHKEDAARLSDTFAQRQNKVLVNDALRVARTFSNLLLLAARDAKLLSELSPSAQTYARFWRVLNTADAAEPVLGVPSYNRLIVWTNQGEFFGHSTGLPEVTRLSDCVASTLCDRPLLEAAKGLPPGRAVVGKTLRWYRPRNDVSVEDQGSLGVAFRSPEAVFVLGIAPKALSAILRMPTFPYESKGDPQEEYAVGNYIYLLDRDTDLIAHPNYWHVQGLDRRTAKPVAPMKSDADAGLRPLNFRAYEQGALRPYFDHLIKKTFQSSEVDVFPAANLVGQIRAVSVAPIYLETTYFDQQGPFGYAGVGCALEHFREPEERLVPYY